jgi:8-oxo-dGTP pyrophosphatase MutT (NUDIX family)
MYEVVAPRTAELASWLFSHAPGDSVEEQHCARMRELIDAPGDPFSGERYTPGHFTASAFVLSPSRDALLLIHHRKLGLWVQPGGHVEPSDSSVLEAARREVREEVGVQALELDHEGLFDVDVHAIPARGPTPAHEHFDVRFLFRARDPAFEASNEVLNAKWVVLAEVARSGADESVLRAVRKVQQRAGLT